MYRLPPPVFKPSRPDKSSHFTSKFVNKRARDDPLLVYDAKSVIFPYQKWPFPPSRGPKKGDKGGGKREIRPNNRPSTLEKVRFYTGKMRQNVSIPEKETRGSSGPKKGPKEGGQSGAKAGPFSASFLVKVSQKRGRLRLFYGL